MVAIGAYTNLALLAVTRPGILDGVPLVVMGGSSRPHRGCRSGALRPRRRRTGPKDRIAGNLLLCLANTLRAVKTDTADGRRREVVDCNRGYAEMVMTAGD